MPGKYYLGFLTALAAFSQSALPPSLRHVPFDDWVKNGDNAEIKWTLAMSPVSLSVYQKQSTSIRMTVDGIELAKRPRRGQIAVFLEILDADNHRYRTGSVLHQTIAQERAGIYSATFTQHVCVLPGDYKIIGAVYDTVTKEHSLRQGKFGVAKLPHDPLPDAWRGLPAVEFSISCDPFTSTPLFLPVKAEKPVRVEVVVNQTANRDSRTGQRMGSSGRLRYPLEVLSEMQLSNGSIHVTVLDLERREVRFTGEVSGPGFPNSLRAAFRERGRRTVTASELQGYKDDARFFVSEVRKRIETIEPGETNPVLIVLSEPLQFRKDLQPIEPEPGTRVLYIRFKFPSMPMLAPAPQLPSPNDWASLPQLPSGGFDPNRWPHISNADSLGRTLSPLHPRVFEVASAMDFRNALAAIMGEISKQD